MRRLLASLVVLAALAGCAAASDDDGELEPLGHLAPVVAHGGPRVPVVVDTDLAGDDLVALAFLLRHPSVRVEAITVAATGLVDCVPGLAVVAGLLHALEEQRVPVACGRSEAPGGREFPPGWSQVAEGGTGIWPRPGEVFAEPHGAVELLSSLARRERPLTVVALGPLTNLADLLESSPQAYRRLAGIHVMGGSVAGPAVDGIAEWNAAADPESFSAVLAGPGALTVVPEDAVPDGTPGALDAPVVAAVAVSVEYPKWWDLSTAAAFVQPDAGEVEKGAWTLDPSELGRLVRSGPGHVRVYRSLDASRLQPAFAEVFASE